MVCLCFMAIRAARGCGSGCVGESNLQKYAKWNEFNGRVYDV